MSGERLPHHLSVALPEPRELAKRIEVPRPVPRVPKIDHVMSMQELQGVQRIQIYRFRERDRAVGGRTDAVVFTILVDGQHGG